MNQMPNLFQGLATTQACSTAVHSREPKLFQLIYGIPYGMQVQMHGPEKCPPSQKIEPGKGDEASRLKVFFAGFKLQLARFHQGTGILQVLQALALIELLQPRVQLVDRFGEACWNSAQHRDKHASHLFQSDLAFVKAVGSTVSEVLDEQKINLVAVNFSPLRLDHVAMNQVTQVFFRLEIGALQQLTQLPNLDMPVHLVEPLAYALNDFGLGAVNRVFQIAAQSHAYLESTIQFGIDRVETPGGTPERRNFAQVERS